MRILKTFASKFITSDSTFWLSKCSYLTNFFKIFYLHDPYFRISSSLCFKHVLSCLGTSGRCLSIRGLPKCFSLLFFEQNLLLQRSYLYKMQQEQRNFSLFILNRESKLSNSLVLKQFYVCLDIYIMNFVKTKVVQDAWMGLYGLITSVIEYLSMQDITRY